MYFEFGATWSYRAKTGYLRQDVNHLPAELLSEFPLENKELVLWSKEGQMRTSRVPVKGERITGIHSKHPLIPSTYVVDDVQWDFSRSPPEPPVVILHAMDRDPKNLKILEKIEGIKD